MQQEMRRQQKELSQLRDRFNAYVAAVAAGADPKVAATAASEDKGKKRAHSSEDEAASSYESAIKKKVSSLPVPDKVWGTTRLIYSSCSSVV